MQRFPCAVLMVLAAAISPLSAQNSIVLPNGYANVEGNTSNLLPWWGSANARTLWVYDSSNLTAQAVASPILVNRLRFRADAAATTTTWNGGAWSRVRIDLSTAAVDYTAPSPTFADNHGIDRTTVLDGPVTVLPGAGNGAGVPGPWYIDVPLAVPFVYDPSSGSDLCIDIMVDGSSWSGGGARSADHQTTNSRACRVTSYNGSSRNPPMGLISYDYGMIMELGFAPAPALQANFGTAVRSGGSPLAVPFTDLSVSSAPGGVLSWAWDFDNDGVTDSTLQNPTWTYTACGTYTVALTVSDSVNPPSTMVRNNFVVTDEVAPDFFYRLVAPDTIQFIDVSVPTPTAWDWDLDGDGVTDSTQQNPSFVYPPAMACGDVNVSLTVSRLCRPPVTLTRQIAVAQSLPTRFDGIYRTATSTSGGTNYFDVNVTESTGILVCGMHVNSSAAAGNQITVNVYVTPGSYVGKHQTASAWRLVASGTATSRGNQQRTFVAFPMPFYLAQGAYGVAVQHVGRSPLFSNILANQTFTNPELSLTAGISQGEPIFGSTSQVLTQRIWNGALHYGSHNVAGNAGYGFFGAGCPGSLGVPGNVPMTLPALGGSASANLTNMPGSPPIAFFVLGFSRTASLLGPLPLELTSFGAPSCWLRVSAEAWLLLVGSAGTATWSVPIPNNATLLGTMFYTQGFVLDAGVNALGAVASDAAAGIIGQ